MQPLGYLPLWPSGCASPNEENTFAPCDEALLPRRLPHPRPRRHPALRRTQQRLVDITTHSISARTGARSWRRTRAMVLQRHGHQCVIRGPHCEISAVEVDHVQPVSEGGSDDPDNCQSSCGPCHAAKTASEAAHGRNRWTDTPPTTSAAGPKADHYDQRTNPAREPGPCAAGTSTGSRGRRSSTDRRAFHPGACVLNPPADGHRSDTLIQIAADPMTQLDHVRAAVTIKNEARFASALMKSASSSARAVGASAKASALTIAITTIFIRRLPTTPGG